MRLIYLYYNFHIFLPHFSVSYHRYQCSSILTTTLLGCISISMQVSPVLFKETKVTVVIEQEDIVILLWWIGFAES